MKLDKKYIIRDTALVCAILLVATLLSFLLKGEKGNTVQVFTDGKLFAEYPLNENRSLPLETELGKNLIVIEDGTVRVSEANCKGKDCVNSGNISRVGECISCLPNKVTVRVSGKSNIDGVAG